METHLSYREKIHFPNGELKLTFIPNKQSDKYIPKLFHEEIEIKYFFEGSSTLLVGEDTIITQPGDIVICNPHEIHSTLDTDIQGGKYHLFLVGLDIFTDAGIRDFDLRYLLIGKQMHFHHLIRKCPVLEQILQRLTQLLAHQTPYSRFQMLGLLLEFFSYLADYASEHTHSFPLQEKNLRYYDIIEPALCKIRDFYYEKLTVDDLASLCNVSKHHFCRIFKLVTNATVIQYITNYRFKMADLKLLYTNSSVAEIARDCGYENESYFCRSYKQQKGISPYQKRKTVLAQESTTPDHL